MSARRRGAARRRFYTSGAKLAYLLRPSALLRHGQAPPDPDHPVVAFLRQSQATTIENSGLIQFDLAAGRSTFVAPKHLKTQLQTLAPDQFIWEGRISIGPAAANQYSFGTQGDFRALVSRYMPGFLKAEAIDPAAVAFYAVVHANTNHPHLHGLMWEQTPSVVAAAGTTGSFRRRGRLDLANIRRFETLASQLVTSPAVVRDHFAARAAFWAAKTTLKTNLKEVHLATGSARLAPVLAEIQTTHARVYSRLSPAAQAQLQQHGAALLNHLPAPLRAHWQHQSEPDFCQAHQELERWIGNRLLRELSGPDPAANPISLARPGGPTTWLYSLNGSHGLNKYEWHRKMNYLRQYHALRRRSAAERLQLMEAACE